MSLPRMSFPTMSLPAWMRTFLARRTPQNPASALVQDEADPRDAVRPTGSSALPASLAARIERVAAGLRDGTVSRADLDASVSGLAALPPSSVAVAGAAVAALLLPPAGRWSSPGVRRDHRRADLAQLGAVSGLDRLFLFHPDGYVREAALRAWEGPARTGFEIAAIAYRLNDWVRPVRSAARDCAARVFPGTETGRAVEALLFLFHRMPEWQRWQGGQAEAPGNGVLGDLMARPDVCNRLAEHLVSARTGPAARLLQRAARWPGLDPALPDLARRAFLPSVRACALRFLIEERATWPEGTRREWVDKTYGLARRVRVIGERRLVRTSDLETLIAMGAGDRSGLVRRVAADGLAVHRAALGERMHALVERLADDTSPSVRWRAAFIQRERAAR